MKILKNYNFLLQSTYNIKCIQMLDSSQLEQQIFGPNKPKFCE